jgi:predicted RNase H-like HicB family nuclease
MSKPRYSMMINWSDEDQAYIVCVPEFGTGAKTHGATFAEAVRMGKDLIDSLIQWAEEEGVALPAPLLFDSATNFAPNPFKAGTLAEAPRNSPGAVPTRNERPKKKVS